MNRPLLLLPLLCACASGSHPAPPDAGPLEADAGPQVSRSLALSADGGSLWVVNPESDSLSELDVGTRTLKRELLLAAARPAQDPATHRFDPAVRPRAVALVDRLGKAYVAGQLANAVIVVDTGSGRILSRVAVGAEPTAVVATPSGDKVFVVNHQSATVQAIDTRTDAVVATLAVGEHPWGASLGAAGGPLFISHLLLGPGVTTVDRALATATFTPLTSQPRDPGTSKLIPNGEVRGAYAVVPRPGTGELWVPHLLLATGTAQPDLDFDSTVFPTLSLLDAAAKGQTRRLLFRPPNALGFPGAFTDSVSGPRDVAFTPDGALALVAMAQSEDVMVFDAATGFEVALARPLPSAMLEGIVVDAIGARAYVHGRGTHDVTVLSIAAGPRVQADGAPIECLQSDPMPANLRRGMRLFYSANSAQAPITQDFWVACSSCHLEGQSDAVTWRFKQGPRDTPSNAGGPINTGFLFRQAVRNDVLQYDETIRVEQGGNYHRTDTGQLPDLQALADFTNYAIPLPQNPNRGAALTASQQHGSQIFSARCTSCHSGPWLTDSGAGNPALDLAGPVLLHDIGTCVTSGAFPDQAATAVNGAARSACQFDTPTLRGVFATAPYFHDGSARTLEDAVARVPGTADLAASDRADLVAFLKTL